jgi:hypothetical protein
MKVLSFIHFNKMYKPVGRDDDVVTLWSDFNQIEEASDAIEEAKYHNKLWTVYSNDAGIILARPGTIYIGGVAIMLTERACFDKDVRVRLDDEDYGDVICDDCSLPKIVSTVAKDHDDAEVHVQYECENCNDLTLRVMDMNTWEILREE